MVIKWIVFFFFSHCQPGRDSSGAAIALFTANLHNPKEVTHRTTLQGVIYQLDAALQSVETQKAGLVFIYDMSSSKYSNFDYELSQRILNLLKVSHIFVIFHHALSSVHLEVIWLLSHFLHSCLHRKNCWAIFILHENQQPTIHL